MTQLLKTGHLAPLALLLTLAPVSGCVTPKTPDVKKVVKVPKSYAGPAVKGKALQRWCSDFGSPQLEALVNSAFDKNLDLRIAFARLKQARAVSAQTNANAWPTVDAGASAGYSRSFTPIPGVGALTQERYSVDGSAGYEVDLWGKLKARRQAARFDMRAARADVEAMAISMTSEIAAAYFDLLQQRQKLELLDKQIEISERYLELTRLRLTQGQANALDVNQQRQQIQSLNAQRTLLTLQAASAEQRLAVLLGENPNAVKVNAELKQLPGLPALPAAGVPADLLERRPDLRAAQLRLEAAERRRIAAVRDRLPSLRISPSIGFQSLMLSTLFETLFYSISGSISQPLIDGGRRSAAVDQSKAVLEERLYSYAQTLLRAIQEVELALLQEKNQELYLQELQKQQESAELALELARNRYRSGSGDYLRVLTSLQSLQNLQQSMVDARRQQLGYRVQLCRALGGTWTKELKEPKGGADNDKSKEGK